MLVSFDKRQREKIVYQIINMRRFGHFWGEKGGGWQMNTHMKSFFFIGKLLSRLNILGIAGQLVYLNSHTTIVIHLHSIRNVRFDLRDSL